MAKTPKQTQSQTCEKCFQYQTMIRGLPTIMYVIDNEHHLIEASKPFLNLLGMNELPETQETFYDLLYQHSQWLEARIHSLRETDLDVLISKTEQVLGEEPPFTDKRGLTFYYESQRLLLKDSKNEVQGLVVNLVDITPQKMLEAQLEELTGGEQKIKTKIRPYPPNIIRDPSQPPKFLVIEDNMLAQEATKSILQELQCTVEFASSTEDVEHLFQPGKFDVIFMDIGLEGTSGYLIAKRIRQIEGQTGYRAPIIALTGFDADLVKTDCDYYFMEGAITKPLTAEQARQVIQYYIYDEPVQIKGLKSLRFKN